MTLDEKIETWTNYVDLTDIQKNNVKALAIELLTDQRKELGTEIEKLKQGKGTHSGVYRDAYFEAIDSVLNLINKDAND